MRVRVGAPRGRGGARRAGEGRGARREEGKELGICDQHRAQDSAGRCRQADPVQKRTMGKEDQMPNMKSNQDVAVDTSGSGWRTLYQIGAAAALTVVLASLAETIITFFPGGSTSPENAVGWFALLQDNWFLGLRNLGLLNIVITGLGIPPFFALFVAHRRKNPTCAGLAMIAAFIGVAVFLATNRAFPMLELSSRYAAATTDAQRSILAAAGEAMLSVGRSHTPGTFLGFLLSEVAGLAISFVMLRSGTFSRMTAYAGILGFALMLLFEVFSSFVSGLSGAAMLLAMGGGVLMMAWYVLTARRLLQLGAMQENTHTP